MSRPKWIRPPGGVCVLWEDHSETDGTDDPHEGALYQQSQGYVRKETDDYIIICRDYDEQEDFSTCLTVLKKNIVRRRVLR